MIKGNEECAASAPVHSWSLTPRQLCDVELLLNGGFAPLDGFLSQADYNSVLEKMRLVDGQLWPIPINLDVSTEFAARVTLGEQIELRDSEGVLIAMMTVHDCWIPDKYLEAQAIFGTDDTIHPGVDYLLNRTHKVYLGGKVQMVELPLHYDYRQYRHRPDELKNLFRKLGWRQVLGYHTCHVMHREEHALTSLAARSVEANLLLQPTVGLGGVESRIDHFTRVRCYEHILRQYPEQTTLLSLLPLAVRLAGPREAIWHALIRKNYGCTHFLVSPNHASPEVVDGQKPFYPTYAARHLAKILEAELGIHIVAPDKMFYMLERGDFVSETELVDGDRVSLLTSTRFWQRLDENLPFPDWFSYPDIVHELRRSYPSRHKQGFTVFFTGLSGSGKSTIANALRIKLLEMGGRPVTLLDGDVVRKNLSSELSFSKEHRDLNIRRIGFVASEITKNGGIAICAPIAPYSHIRREVRDVVSAVGGFLEVHVATPIEECERRDRKGLYAKARAGLLKQFTGIDDPYEVPVNPELTIDTTEISPDECANRVLLKLENLGFIKR